MQWADFHFLRPLWLAGLVPAAALLALLWRGRGAGSGWEGLIAPPLLQHLVLGRSEHRARLPLILLGCGWVLAVVALAGPTWERLPQALYRASLDQVVVLDLSPSMARADVAPDRLTRARFAVSDLLAQTREGRTALIVFGAEQHVVAPLTDDAATVEQLLRALTVDIVPAPGDRAAAALRASVQLLAAAKSRVAHVVLLSDGVSDPADSIAAARELRAAGAKLSVIGVGPGQQAQLRELARSGGGVYQPLGSRGAHPALQLRAEADFSQPQDRQFEADSWVEYGAWLLLPLLMLAALGYRRGWLAVFVLALCQAPQEAMALSWDDLWLTPDQQAKRLLDAGQARRAADRFKDPNWRAAAHYQSGEFDEAAAQFEATEAAYNRANALAKAGQLDEAIKAYDEALRARPDDADARFNRELVRSLLEQQQAQQGQDPQGEEGQKSQAQQNDGDRQQGQEQPRDQDPQQGRPQDQDPQQGRPQDQDQQQGQPQENSARSPQDVEQSAQQGAESSQSQATQPTDRSRAGPQQPRAGQDARQQEGAPSGDASPGAAGADDEQGDDKHRQAASDVAPRPAAPPGAARPAGAVREGFDERPRSEQELALQQWLRQVPDDPGGLLRRKFMLEHLQRQKERSTP